MYIRLRSILLKHLWIGVPEAYKYKVRANAIHHTSKMNSPDEEAEHQPQHDDSAKYPPGTSYLKNFNGYGVWEGRITSFDGEHYHVIYDEDGYVESFSRTSMDEIMEKSERLIQRRAKVCRDDKNGNNNNKNYGDAVTSSNRKRIRMKTEKYVPPFSSACLKNGMVYEGKIKEEDSSATVAKSLKVEVKKKSGGTKIKRIKINDWQSEEGIKLLKSSANAWNTMYKGRINPRTQRTWTLKQFSKTSHGHGMKLATFYRYMSTVGITNPSSNKVKTSVMSTGARSAGRGGTLTQGDTAATQTFKEGEHVWVEQGKTRHAAVVVSIPSENTGPKMAKIRWSTMNTLADVEVEHLFPMFDDKERSASSKRERKRTIRFEPPPQLHLKKIKVHEFSQSVVSPRVHKKRRTTAAPVAKKRIKEEDHLESAFIQETLDTIKKLPKGTGPSGWKTQTVFYGPARQKCTQWISPSMEIVFKHARSAFVFEELRQQCNGDEEEALYLYRCIPSIKRTTIVKLGRLRRSPKRHAKMKRSAPQRVSSQSQFASSDMDDDDESLDEHESMTISEIQEDYNSLYNYYLKPQVRVNEEIAGSGMILRKKTAQCNLLRFKNSKFRQNLHKQIMALEKIGRKDEIHRLLKELKQFDLSLESGDGPSELMNEILGERRDEDDDVEYLYTESASALSSCNNGKSEENLKEPVELDAEGVDTAQNNKLPAGDEQTCATMPMNEVTTPKKYTDSALKPEVTPELQHGKEEYVSTNNVPDMDSKLPAKSHEEVIDLSQDDDDDVDDTFKESIHQEKSSNQESGLSQEESSTDETKGTNQQMSEKNNHSDTSLNDMVEPDCIDLSAFLENESNQQPEMIDLSIDLHQEDLPVQSEVIVLD